MRLGMQSRVRKDYRETKTEIWLEKRKFLIISQNEEILRVNLENCKYFVDNFLFWSKNIYVWALTSMGASEAEICRKQL